MSGKIHSLESFGTVDGPGVRFVVFLQGCPMRCAYCHNPDTWSTEAGSVMEASDIIRLYERNRGYYREGGITVTGGEPLMQLDFIYELFTLAKETDAHTCIDTSGIVYQPNNPQWMEKLNRVLDLTDLVMLDIKHIDNDKHIELTGLPNTKILAFAEYISSESIPLWIRHVVVPGITDDDKYLFQLGYYIGHLKSLKALDVLPYHTMGAVKYEKLGMDYRLKDVPAMDKNKIAEKKQVILDGIKKYRGDNQK